MRELAIQLFDSLSMRWPGVAGDWSRSAITRTLAPPALAGGPCGGSRSRHTASDGALPVPGASVGLVGRARAGDKGGKARYGREHRRLGLVLVAPAAEVAGQPARGRGIASERRVARTWPASGGERADPLPSEARDAPWRRRASLGPTAFFQ